MGDKKRLVLSFVTGSNYQHAWEERTGIEYDQLRRPDHKRRFIRHTVVFTVLVTVVGVLGLAAMFLLSAWL